MTAKIKLNAASGGGSISINAPSSAGSDTDFLDTSGNLAVSGTTTCTGNVTCSNDLSVNNDLKADSGFGSTTTIYGVRAWIAFKAAGGSNTVRGSGNATITDHGTGDFTMNFTTAMPDTGYSAVGTAGFNSGLIVFGLTGAGAESAPTTSGFRFSIRANYNNSTLLDEEYINLIVVR